MSKRTVRIIRLLPTIIFLAGILISPFVFWPKAVIRFEIPRVWFILRFTEILGVSGLIGLFYLKKEVINARIILLVVLFLLAVFISSIIGVDPIKSFWGNYYRSEGFFTLVHLTGLFFFVALFFDAHLKKFTPYVIFLSSSILSLWSLTAAIRLYLLGDKSIDNWEGAFGLSFGNPNFLGGYLLVCLPFTALIFEQSRSKKAKILYSSLLIIQIIAIFLTKSWGAILGIVLFILGWFLLKKKIKFKFAIPIILGFWVLLSIQFLNNLYTSKFTPESRERIFRKGITAFTKRPLLGWGWANFDYAYESVDWPLKFQHDVYVDKAHSSLFEVLVTTGIVGFIIYLTLILEVIKNLLRAKKAISLFYLLSFLLVVFHSQTNVTSINEELIFWLIIGISAKNFS